MEILFLSPSPFQSDNVCFLEKADIYVKPTGSNDPELGLINFITNTYLEFRSDEPGLYL